MPTEMPRRRGRPKRKEGAEPPAGVIWRNGRAYGDFRAWKPWGGSQEPLVASGERYATTSSTTAAILFGKRLEQLRDARKQHPGGPRVTDELDRIPAFIGYHLGKKATVTGRKRPSPDYLAVLRSRLVHAARFLEWRGRRTLAEITAEDIRAFADHLAKAGTADDQSRIEESPGRLKPTTQRRYLDALGQVLARAVAEGRIERNWVGLMVDKPTVDSSPTEHLELWECALILDAARRAFPPDRVGPPVYAMIAFHLLTGVTDSERAGVELADVRLPGDGEYPRGVIMIRPNPTRDSLKTLHRERLIPVHPQLAEILTEYLRSPSAPSGPLLFPSPGSDGSIPIRDWTKLLDQAAAYGGFAKGEIRTRRLRVSYATHRLNTLDENGQPMTAWKLRGEMGHGTEQMIEERYGRYAKHRGTRPVLEYRWDEWEGRFGDRRATPPSRPLTPGQRVMLAALAETSRGLTAKEWELAVGVNPGTFYPRRDRVVALGLAEREGNRRGSRFRITEAGQAALASDAAAPANTSG